MSKKIKLTETELVNIIQKIVKEDGGINEQETKVPMDMMESLFESLLEQSQIIERYARYQQKMLYSKMPARPDGGSWKLKDLENSVETITDVLNSLKAIYDDRVR
tara:strand:- start:76 stop:390 length:315 start_codon:yes stop_codon:yes gene_type:complete